MPGAVLQKVLQNRELLLLVLQQRGLLNDLLLLLRNLLLLLSDLRLLFVDGVDEGGADAVIFDTFDLPLLVIGDQQWLNSSDIFSTEAQVEGVTGFPPEGDRLETVDERQSANERLDSFLVAQGRRAGGKLIRGVAAQLCAASRAERADCQVLTDGDISTSVDAHLLSVGFAKGDLSPGRSVDDGVGTVAEQRVIGAARKRRAEADAGEATVAASVAEKDVAEVDRDVEAGNRCGGADADISICVSTVDAIN